MPTFDSSAIPFVRDTMLILDSATLFCTGLFGLILLGQWIRSKHRTPLDLKLAWSVFYFGLVCNTVAFMISTYWVIEEPEFTHWVALGYGSLLLALTTFFFAVERILPYRTSHALTMAGLAFVLLTLMVPRSMYVLIAAFAACFALAGILLFLRYARDITTGKVRRDVLAVTVGFIIGWMGFVARSDLIYYAMGESFYIAGQLFLLAGVTIFGYVLTYTVALDELDWENQLVGVYLIQQGGLLVFHYSVDSKSDANEVLAAAGISGVQSLFQEITKTEEGFNIISIGEYELLFAHGNTVTGVLIARRSYRIFLEKIHEFVTRFERMLGPVMGRFSGPMDDFEPARDLAKSIFSEK